jgi:hypothetical protein
VGTRTVGVKRQYVRCAGRVSNTINVVYCSFATAAGHALVGARPPGERCQRHPQGRRGRPRGGADRVGRARHDGDHVPFRGQERPASKPPTPTGANATRYPRQVVSATKPELGGQIGG